MMTKPATTPLEYATNVLARAAARGAGGFPHDIRIEGTTVTFEVGGVRFCAVVEYDEGEV
jgi:hypothetical protein